MVKYSEEDQQSGFMVERMKGFYDGWNGWFVYGVYEFWYDWTECIGAKDNKSRTCY